MVGFGLVREIFRGEEAQVTLKPRQSGAPAGLGFGLGLWPVYRQRFLRPVWRPWQLIQCIYPIAEHAAVGKPTSSPLATTCRTPQSYPSSLADALELRLDSLLDCC